MSIRAKNLVNEFTVTQLLYVQEHVEGLRLLADVYPVIPTQSVMIAWEIAYGTEVLFTVNLGMQSFVRFTCAPPPPPHRTKILTKHTVFPIFCHLKKKLTIILTDRSCSIDF